VVQPQPEIQIFIEVRQIHFVYTQPVQAAKEISV